MSFQIQQFQLSMFLPKEKKKTVNCQSVNNLWILAQSLSQKNYYDVIIVV